MSSSPAILEPGEESETFKALTLARLSEVYQFLTKGLTDAEAVTNATVAALNDQQFKIKQQQLEHAKTALALSMLSKELATVAESHAKQGEALASTTASLQKHLDLQQAQVAQHQRMRSHLRKDIGKRVMVELLGMPKDAEEAMYTSAKIGGASGSIGRQSRSSTQNGRHDAEVQRSRSGGMRRSVSSSNGGEGASRTLSASSAAVNVSPPAASAVVPPLASLLGGSATGALSKEGSPASLKKQPLAEDAHEGSAAPDEGESSFLRGSAMPAGVGALTARPSMADPPLSDANNEVRQPPHTISPHYASLQPQDHHPQSLANSFGGALWQAHNNPTSHNVEAGNAAHATQSRSSRAPSFSRSVSRAESPVPNMSLTNVSLSRSASPSAALKRETLSVSPATASISAQMSQHARHTAPARRQSMSASPEASLEAFVAFSESKSEKSFSSPPVVERPTAVVGASSGSAFERPLMPTDSTKSDKTPQGTSATSVPSQPIPRPSIVSSSSPLLLDKDGKRSSKQALRPSASPSASASPLIMAPAQELLREHGGQPFWATEAAIREDAPLPVVMALVKCCGGPRAVYEGDGQSSAEESMSSATRSHASTIDGLGGFLGATAFHFAAYHGRDDVLEALCAEDEGGGEVRIRDKKGYLPLHEAVRADQQATVHWFIKGPQKVSVNARCMDGAYPIHIAAMNGLMAMTTMLMALGSDIQGKTINGLTPLHAATVGGCAPLAALLVEKGADVNARDNIRRTPLHQAAANKDEAMVNTLITLGALATERDSRGAVPDLSWMKEKP